jgi:phage I-like protein
MIKAMNTLAVKNDTKIDGAVRTVLAIKADATGKAPQQLQLVQAGEWPGSYKGNLIITTADLLQMKANFDAGVGLPDNGSQGAPIDYSHNDWDKAAGWITAVDIVDDMLVATAVSWTPAAQQAIADGEFKFFSPSFYPSCIGAWCDPEDPTIIATNVVLGGGLTNQPFFKGLKGLKASQSESGQNSQSVIYVSASQERNPMTKTLEEIKKTPVGEITEDDRAVLKEPENFKTLTADEQIAFGVVAKVEPVAPIEPATPLADSIDPAEPVAPVATELAAVQASLKAGTHIVVPKAEYEGIKASVAVQADTLKRYERERIDASVAKAIGEGKIVASEATNWGNKIEADATMLDFMNKLPANPILASEVGDAHNGENDAVKVLTQKASELIEASTIDGVAKLDMKGAIVAARKANPALAKAYDEQISNS